MLTGISGSATMAMMMVYSLQTYWLPNFWEAKIRRRHLYFEFKYLTHQKLVAKAGKRDIQVFHIWGQSGGDFTSNVIEAQIPIINMK
jgi:hypothetical protein